MRKVILVSIIFVASNLMLSAQAIIWYGYKGLDPQLQGLGIQLLDTTKIKGAKLDTTMSQSHETLTFSSSELIDIERRVTCDEIKVFQSGGNEEVLFTLKKGDKVRLISVNIYCSSMCIYDTAIRLENGEEYLIRGAESLKDKIW